MAAKATIHVLPGQHGDWIVREEGGRELGHYPSRQAAEAVGHKLARKRQAELMILDRDGKVKRRSRPGRSWLGRLLGG